MTIIVEKRTIIERLGIDDEILHSLALTVDMLHATRLFASTVPRTYTRVYDYIYLKKTVFILFLILLYSFYFILIA